MFFSFARSLPHRLVWNSHNFSSFHHVSLGHVSNLKQSAVRVSFQQFCDYALHSQPPTPHGRREKILASMFIESGADSLDSSLACDSLESYLLRQVGGQDDPVIREIVHKIVTIADLDQNQSINFHEFCQWFEPLTDQELNLKQLFAFWSKNSELKSPKVIFNNVWAGLVMEFGEINMNFPSEILCLGGAPGSGKGTNTPFIARERQITASPIVMSSLLRAPAMQKLKAEGRLVGDYEVLKTILRELLHPRYRSGAVVDGFPRTAIQVEFLRLLRDNMTSLQQKYSGAEPSIASRFLRPAFRIIVLYVNETESVRRQLARGRRAIEHNEQVRQTGKGELMEVRETDTSVNAARNRYKVFSEEALDALQSLKKEFPYHVIDASGSVEAVEREIIRELAYQSSLELNQDTYEAIRILPTSKDVISHARQRLVERLDRYESFNQQLFHQVISVIKRLFVPTLTLHALSGAARVVIPKEDDAWVLFDENSVCFGMVVDILADREFSVYAVEKKDYGHMFDIRFHSQGLFHKDQSDFSSE